MLLNSEVSLLGLLGFSTFEEAVLQEFGNFVVAYLAHRRDPHTLQPSADRELAVQGEPDEGANLARAGAMPNSGQHL